MADPTTEFFDRLGRRGHERLLEEATGTIRFDLIKDQHTVHWFLVVRQGNVRVSRDEREVDCVIRTDRTLFDRLVSGEERIHAVWARHELKIEGDLGLARIFQRVLPGPPGARHPRTFARERRQQA